MQKIMTDDEFNIIKKEVAKHNQFAINELYETYKNFMYASIKNYPFEQDEKDYVIDMGFTLIIIREPMDKIDRSTFQRFLWTRCQKDVARKFIRDTRNTGKAKFNNEVVSYDDVGQIENNNYDNWIDNLGSIYNLENEVIIREKLAKINRIVNTYKHKEAVRCFKMVCIDGLDSNKVSDKMNISRKTVNSFINQVRKYLKKRGVDSENY